MKTKHLLILVYAIAVCTGATAQQVVPVKNFGINGTFKQTANDEYANARHAIIQPNGKLLFSLTTSDEFGYSISQFIYRLTENGNPDSSFGTNGMIRVGRPNVRQGLTLGGYFDLQPNGKIVTANVMADRSDNYTNRLVVERFLPDGTPDSSFGIKKDGAFTYENEGGNQYYNFRVNGVKVKPNGKILVFGINSYANGTTTVFMELNSDGRIDRSFGDSGLLQGSLPYEQNVSEILPLPNNQFITASLYLNADSTTVGSCLVAHKADGTIDSSRGINGVALNNNTVYIGNNVFYTKVAIGLRLQPDNKLLENTVDYINNTLMGVLLRYNTDGTPDKSFGNNGRVITDTIGYYNLNYPGIVATQANGRIVVSVLQQLQRYHASGTPDATFGTNGLLAQPTMNESMAFTLNKDRLYVVGTAYGDDGIAQVLVNAYQFCNHCTEDSTGLITRLKVPEVISDNIKLYPNPVRDKLIVAGLSNGAISNLQFTDASGRIVLKAATQNATFQWNIKALPAGVYYLLITNKHNALPVSFKVIKE